MKKLVNKEIVLPLWTPLTSDLDPEIIAHLTSLSIPCLNGKPNLLLHDMGSFTRDPLLDKRLKNIFMPNNHTWAHPSFCFCHHIDSKNIDSWSTPLVLAKPGF
jgi:hypothetical protein